MQRLTATETTISEHSVTEQDTLSNTAISVVPSEASQTVSDTPHTRSTGLLYKLPHVSAPNDLVASAVRKARRIARHKKLTGPAAQARNLAARQMDRLMKELSTPLTGYLRGFPLVEKLHGFEGALLDLTISAERYNRVLSKVLQLRKTATTMGKEFAARAGRADSKKDAENIAEEGFSSMEGLFTKNQKVLLDLIAVTRELRKLPKLDLDVPTLALVGAPNVGKSSIVQAISSGLPEICNYPFTTRTIKMGHFYVDGQRHQVTDTPGLLNRPESEKNSLELLTMATLRFLPTAVVFVIDATEHCGTNIDDQLEIRSHLKETFPSKLWIDVFSKADLLQEPMNQPEDLELSSLPTALMARQVKTFRTMHEAVRLSCFTSEGMEAFKRCVIQLFSASQVLTHDERS